MNLPPQRPTIGPGPPGRNNLPLPAAAFGVRGLPATQGSQAAGRSPSRARISLLGGPAAAIRVLGAGGTVANAMPAVPKPTRPGAPALSPHAATDPPYDKTHAPWGPDVSGWQHPAGGGINWAAVRGAGASFAFVKATNSS
jgi:hypothetical protein